MLRYIKSDADIFGMAKVSSNFVIKDVRKFLGDCDSIYFSKKLASHGPRIKFHGGTKKTGITRNMPAITVEQSKLGQLERLSWHDDKNCPNSYNAELVNNLRKFVYKYRAVLLLTWFFHFDESAVERYFSGEINFNKLMQYLEEVPDYVYRDMQNCRQLKDLHKYCLKHDLYKLPSGFEFIDEINE